jgi:hypothetical protein
MRLLPLVQLRSLSALRHAAWIFSRTAGAVPRGAYLRAGRKKSKLGNRPRASVGRDPEPSLSSDLGVTGRLTRSQRARHLWHLRPRCVMTANIGSSSLRRRRPLTSLPYPAFGSRARSIAFASQVEPRRRNFTHRAGVRRTEPGTLFCSTGSARLPLRRGATVVPSPRPLALFVAIKHHGWSCGLSCRFHGAAA